jgi:tRNA modification GTPase
MIIAFATPPGVAGVAVARVSGSDVLKVFSALLPEKTIVRLKAHPAKLFLSPIYDLKKELIDTGLIVYFERDKSFTGEETLEFHVHGSPIVQEQLLENAFSLGVRLAEPGEFTRMAFLNGKLDLTQAEALGELINAKTLNQKNLAQSILNGELKNKIDRMAAKLLAMLLHIEASIDFPEEVVDLNDSQFLSVIEEVAGEIQELILTASAGNAVREGIRVAIVGKPNVGKSSFFNLLLKQDRAIVSAVAGTTRDYLKEEMNYKGHLIKWIDTAGLRETKEEIEKAGIEKAKDQIKNSDLVIFLIDDLKDKPVSKPNQIIVFNKIDLIDKHHSVFSDKEILPVSVLRAIGMPRFWEVFEKRMAAFYLGTTDYEILINQRHRNSLYAAGELLKNLKEKISLKHEADLLSIDLKEAVKFLKQVTGQEINETVLTEIFNKFCIGK